MHYLVLDFGGSSVKCAVMTEEARILEQFKVESKADSYPLWLERFTPQFKRCNEKYVLHGIAISTCGAVDVDTGVIHGSSALPYIHGIDVRSLFEQKFYIPTELENDACCAALAEAWLGAGKDSDHFCTLVIGSGIGGAIVTNQLVQKGYNLHGGEFGYTVADFSSGKPVILSEIASTQALVNRASVALNQAPEALNGMEVFRRYNSGDEQIVPVVEHWFHNLAIAIYNIQYSIDPERILVGGAVSKQLSFLKKINEKLEQIMSAIPIAQIRPNIQVARFGNDANLIGALKHYLDRQGK